MKCSLFNCTNTNDKDILNHFNTVFLPKCKLLEDESPKVFIGKHVYQSNVVLEEVNVIFRILKTEWILLQSVALYDVLLPFEELLLSREIVNKSFIVLKESLQFCSCPSQKERYKTSVLNYLKIISSSIIPAEDLECDVLLKSTTCSTQFSLPIYQYFHTFLEIQYHLLTLNYISGATEETMRHITEKVIVNLIIISRTYHQRKNTVGDLFVCSCIKQFWVLIQLFCEKVMANNYFWIIFNKSMENEESLFSLLLLKDISRLHLLNGNLDEEHSCERIRPNYELLQNKLNILLANADPDILERLFNIIEPLVSSVWLKHAKIEVFQIIWDYYSKRLNISCKKYTSLTAIDFNDILENILFTKKCNEHFEIFISLLISHLKEHPLHWSKMKGRIYSQLGPNKVKDLSEVGITHVMLLFIALTNVNYEELSKKILAFLQSFSKERNTALIWNLYTAFMFQQVRKGQTLEKSAVPLLLMLQEASCDNNNFRLVKDFMQNFEHLLNFSTNMQLQQWLLLNFWLGKYLNSCYYADLQGALDVLLSTLERVENADCWSYWEPAFREYVYPVLKALSTNHTAPITIGSIAGKLCLLIPQISSGVFNFFNGESVMPKITFQFLDIILENYPMSFMLTQQQESVVIQSWVKICLLLMDSSKQLTKHVLKLDYFPMMLKSHIATSLDPIYAFIEYLGSDIKCHSQSSSINKLCDLCFGQLDRWLTPYLYNPENEATVFRLYTCISLAVLHCGPLLYHRNKSSSPLTALLQCVLLSTEFLRGKSLHPFVMNTIKKTWHLFFEAINKLSNGSDLFLERTLRDIITKYVPYFPTSDSPIVKCLENETDAPVLLEKICNSYFKHPVKESDANMLKVLKILSDTVQSTTSLVVMKAVVNKTLYGLFEVVIFHSQRNTAINIIKLITSSPLYPQVKSEFASIIITITEKHLTFNAINYFQLLYILAKFVPADVKSLLGGIKQQVSNVERLRGVGFDKNLRLQFEKLENTVKEHSVM